MSNPDNLLEEKKQPDPAEQKVEAKVMEQIQSGTVKLRSKYVYLAEKFGLGSAAVFSIMLAVLFFSLMFFYLKFSDSLIYLRFGTPGLFAFIESFPFLLVAVFVLFLLLSGYLIKKTEFTYKKPFGYVALGLLALVVLFGVGLAFTGVVQKIENAAYGANHPAGVIFEPFFKPCYCDKKYGLAGRVLDAQSNYIMIQTPRSIRLMDVAQISSRQRFEIQAEMFVVAVGKMRHGVFVAEQIREVAPEEMMMIIRNLK